ncbi:UDP-glycosyltransferase [Quillaja saponaria]|uniref:UDP-glycosyltransferase n=1 Tax=Quillaja saponaria TaxID=32244 RepID=A0AAD7LWA4_QUISA|nr:UDP-glycosyltransferase [Quillaja saponaria]
MEWEQATTTACHIVAMPYPGRGHINPLMNLFKFLITSKKITDIIVTFVVTEEWLSFMGSQPKPDNIRFRSMPNVIPSELVRADDFVDFFEAVMTKMEAPFENILDRLQPPPTLILSDTFLFWAVAVGNRRNIPVASFWPMSASVFSVFQHFDLFEGNGHFPVNLLERGEERVDYIPGISSTRLMDFPNFLDRNSTSQKLLQWILKSLSWVPKAQYLLFPSIYELEPKVIDVLRADLSLPIYTIGPCIPYFSIGGENPSDQSSLSYLQWLDCQPTGSVLYISQGSFLSVSSAQIHEIAAGLCDSGVRFLWIARGEVSKLKEVCGNNGLVLDWCDQMKVLLHRSVGGFWTHCGWNSTREGVFAGVPFLTFPITMDQMLNAKIMEEDWKIGWTMKKEVGVDTLVTRSEIVGLLNKFMDLESDVAKDMRKRARQLQQICQAAIGNGGSSETNINAFVKDIVQCHVH